MGKIETISTSDPDKKIQFDGLTPSMSKPTT